MELTLESAGIKLKLDEKAIDKRHAIIYSLHDNRTITVLHIDEAIKILKFLTDWINEYFEQEVKL